MAEPAYILTPPDEDVAAQSHDDEALLLTARARFDRSVEAEHELREQFRIDQRYRAGGAGQWPDQVSRDRAQDQRPALTINLIPGAIAQITNEQRANRPSLRASPRGDGATEEVAKICDGWLRGVQQDSRADIAYDTAAAEAAGPGRGWFRIITEYESPTTFAQVPKILSIPNAMSVYPQPHLREPDYSDMEWCFVVEDVAHDEFLHLYPGMQPEAFEAWAQQGDDPWITQDTVRVAEYFYREYEAHTLALLSDRTVIDYTQGTLADTRATAFGLGLQVIQTRTAQHPLVWWCKLNGRQVLARERWLGSWIPIIPVLGDSFYVDGQVRLSGLIRDSRDSQCMINYWESARTEAIALAPRAPWVMVAGQDEGFQDEWDTANTRNHSVLHYKNVSINGTPAPPPQRNVQEPAIQALNVACQSAKDNFQATTRIYDASYGAPGNERSGRAIQQRDQNSDMSNSHYHGNLGRSMHHAGRILLELLPKLCDEPGRMLRLLLEDGTEKQVMVNQEHVDPATQQQRCYLLAQGTYAVTVDAGPSYERQRQDGVATMADMAKADPKIMAVADDLVVGAMAFPGAKEIAKRLKKTIDPQLLDDDAPDAETRLALAQGQLKQVSEQAQALNAHAGEVEQAHQASMQECQQLQAALDAAKADRQGQVLDDQAKRRELAQRETEDQRQAVLDSRKLDLEAGKLTLEQQKIDLDVQTHLLARATAQETQQQAQHTRQQAVYAQADHDETTEMEAIVKFQEMQDAMGQLQGVPAQLAQIAASLTALQQAEAARCAPKSVQMHRGPDGALVGTVTDPAGKVTRRLALAKAGTGYTGEVA